MTDKLTSGSAGRRLVTRTAVLLILLSAARTLGVLYSYAATDIRYLETFLPTFLHYARQFFTSAAFGAGVAFTAIGVFFGDTREGRQMFLLHAGILLADAAAALFIDGISGAVSGESLLLAALSVGAGWLWSVLLAFLGWIAARRVSRRAGAVERALFISSAVYMAGRLLLETVYLIQFLIQVEFVLYSEEIVVIVGEYLSIVFLYGGVTFLASCLFERMFFCAHTQKT